jgi:histidine triad (HIT) family protein
MESTIFSRILRGEVPCHRVYEDDLVLAFLDVNPLARGHLLLIPKEAAETLDQLSDDAAAALGRAIPRLSRALKQVTGVQSFNVLSNNGVQGHQAVPYVHFHLIPKPNQKEGLGIQWPMQSLEQSEGAQLARELAAAAR